MRTIESVKSSVLKHILEHVRSLKIPFYQYVPQRVKAPFGCIKFLDGDWKNDLPGVHFQAIVFLQIKILSDYKGLMPIHLLIESVSRHLDGYSMTTPEGSKFWVFYHLTELEGQQDSVQHKLRSASIRFEIKWRG